MTIGKKADEVRVNEQIRARVVRLISAAGDQLGIISVREALDLAEKDGLDLVEVAPNSDPPVCRVMDYGKFRYETSKKVQETRKKSRGGQMKEIKLRPYTEEHDLGFKMKNLKKFLEKKHRVKVTVFFRGREMAFISAGEQLLNRLAAELGEEATVEQPPTREARNRMTMVVIPK
ncbi:MAG TPA: translation initiation factor IF-3 [Deltaproteobacteria bacterium]|nr:translation initiation factor IF-3 [Deltaproteobacteria bacterium]HIJ39975.1 translation initiation factor IF-3 [Deltaproteobacteria bacterium]